MVRRLKAQRLRFLLNRLTYLLPLQDFNILIDLTPDVVEFLEYRSLLRAIKTNNLDEILPFPGPAVNTFGSYFRELESNEFLKYGSTPSNSTATFESLCTLSLFGAVTLSDYLTTDLSCLQIQLLQFCQFDKYETRLTGDQSFEDEIRALQLGLPKNKLKAIIDSRFSDLESISLEALLFQGTDS